MKRKTATLLLIALSAIGSVIVFYATNLILSDVSNMFYMTLTHDCISSIPCFMIALDFVLASVYVFHFYTDERYRKRLTLLYSKILFAFSVVGILSVIYAAFVLYGSWLAPYPFPFASIVFLLFHLLMAAHSFQTRGIAKKMPDDPEKRKITIGHILNTVVICVTFFFSYNRFGAFLLAPLYIQWSTFSLTYPFYLALLLPMALCCHMTFYVFGYIRNHPNAGLIHISIVFFMNILLGFAVMYTGYHNPAFIAAISPALAIERLLTLPIDTIAHHVLVALLCIIEFFYALAYKKRHKKTV